MSPTTASGRRLGSSFSHDVSDNSLWTPTRLELLDRVLVLSEYHRSCFPAVPDHKVFLTRNGADSQLIESYAGAARDPKRIIYSSSPDRGLVQAINAFQLAQQQDPELKLDIFYGFTPYYYGMAAKNEYGHIVTQGRVRHLLEFAEEVRDVVDKTPGARFAGRVSCTQMSKEMAAAGVWLYPAPFTEISCMAAMEAQAAGMAVVASDVAALKETIDWSSPLAFRAQPDDDPNTIAENILKATDISEDSRQVQAEAARKRFCLDALAQEWVRELFAIPQ
jgi:glycosyltransferase involved in cell wall biosynthesis